MGKKDDSSEVNCAPSDMISEAPNYGISSDNSCTDGWA